MKSNKRLPQLGAILIILIVTLMFLTTLPTENIAVEETNIPTETVEIKSEKIDEQGSEKEEPKEEPIVVKQTAKPVQTTTPDPTQQPEETSQNTETNMIYLGQFKTTAYCNCSKCCGIWAGGPTASGAMPVAGRTIAVDPNVVPIGSTVFIDGHAYIAEDTGSGVYGNSIDIFHSSHQAALNWGVRYKNVYLAA